MFVRFPRSKTLCLIVLYCGFFVYFCVSFMHASDACCICRLVCHLLLMQMTSMEDRWKKSIGHWIANSHLQILSTDTIVPALSIIQGVSCTNDIQFEFQNLAKNIIATAFRSLVWPKFKYLRIIVSHLVRDKHRLDDMKWNNNERTLTAFVHLIEIL